MNAPIFESGLAALLVAGLVGPAAASGEADNPYADRPQTCAGCHETLGPEDTFTLGNGTEISAHVDPEALGHSVHADDLGCTDCHRRMRGYPHEPIRAADEREFRLTMSQTCNRCHYEHFTRVVDSIHFEQLSNEEVEAPTCVDCHDNHEIEDPRQPRLAISDRCSSCHEETAETYATSVHGESLAKGSEDAPVCTDCHGAHEISDTKSDEFHAGSYQICANCHGDAEKMKEYDLNPNVLDTYLDDFHGVSNYLYTQVGHIPERPMATCGDCHGVHDVQRFDDEGDRGAVRERVATMCQSCHEDANSSFAGAWMSHEDPSLSSSPLVWAVLWGYRILIPVMIVGLLLHIFLHFWRAAVEHAQKGARS